MGIAPNPGSHLWGVACGLREAGVFKKRITNVGTGESKERYRVVCKVGNVYTENLVDTPDEVLAILKLHLVAHEHD